MNRIKNPPLAGTDGWLLTPEGAAFLPAEGVAVIADVHLGYEWARGARGDMLPPHSRAESLARLESLLKRHPVRRLIVAGDLVESPLPGATQSDVRAMAAWLRDQGAELIRLRGNHEGRTPTLPSQIEVGGWTIAHGDTPIHAAAIISGHVHPMLRIDNVTAPCFLVGPKRIVLPAFSSNAAGLNVAAGVLPDGLDPVTLRCVATSGTELFDFGTIDCLRLRLEPKRR